MVVFEPVSTLGSNDVEYSIGYYVYNKRDAKKEKSVDPACLFALDYVLTYRNRLFIT